MSLPVYIDIDGTLTDSPNDPHGIPIDERILKVRAILKDGMPVVIWSARGTLYAKRFVKTHKLRGAIALGKPCLCVDDKPGIRPNGKMPVISPEEYFRMV